MMGTIAGWQQDAEIEREQGVVVDGGNGSVAKEGGDGGCKLFH